MDQQFDLLMDDLTETIAELVANRIEDRETIDRLTKALASQVDQKQELLEQNLKLAWELEQRRQDTKRLLNIARGCHDYGGGYKDAKDAGVFHHGIQTVINALEAATKNPNDSQAIVLERIGMDAMEAGEGGPGAPSASHGQPCECPARKALQNVAQRIRLAILCSNDANWGGVRWQERVEIIEEDLSTPCPLEAEAADLKAKLADVEQANRVARDLLDQSQTDVERLRSALAEARELHPAEDWSEDDGFVLWWHLPIQEPPEVGSHECMGEQDPDGEPTACARLQREGWLTHWSRIPHVDLAQWLDLEAQR